jgi:hypothetical protein
MGNTASQPAKEDVYSVTVYNDGTRKVQFSNRADRATVNEILLSERSPQTPLPEVVAWQSPLQLPAVGSPSIPTPPLLAPPPYEVHLHRPSPEKFVMIPHPTHADLLTAAYLFDQIAQRYQLPYAIIGGLSAHILGGGRQTKTLDILTAPRLSGNQYLLGPLLNDLWDQNPSQLQYTQTNRHGHIVVTRGNSGVPINFIDCVNNIYNFPNLVGPTRPDGRPWNHEDPEPTWDYRWIPTSPNFPGPIRLPVVLPRLLLSQRILHFGRSHATVNTKTKDVKDITVYLTALFRVDHQSFTDDEARILLPKIRDVLRFAYQYNGTNAGLIDACNIEKWLWINIPIVEGEWTRW